MPLDGRDLPRFQVGIMKSHGFPLLLALLLLPGCDDKSSPDSQQSAASAKAGASGSTGFGEDDDSPAQGKTKRADRPARTAPPPVAEAVPGQVGKVISPFSGAIVDVTGSAPGDIVEDPGYPDDKTKKFMIPDGLEAEPEGEPPVALTVPGNNGMVFSPFNNKMVDVRGIPAGTLVQDPSYPPAAKKFFRVPELIEEKPPEPESPPAESEPGEAGE